MRNEPNTRTWSGPSGTCLYVDGKEVAVVVDDPLRVIYHKTSTTTDNVLLRETTEGDVPAALATHFSVVCSEDRPVNRHERRRKAALARRKR